MLKSFIFQESYPLASKVHDKEGHGPTLQEAVQKDQEIKARLMTRTIATTTNDLSLYQWQQPIQPVPAVNPALSVMNAAPLVMNPTPLVMNPAAPPGISVPPMVRPALLGTNPASSYVSLVNNVQPVVHQAVSSVSQAATLQPVAVHKLSLQTPQPQGRPVQVPTGAEIIGWKRCANGDLAPILGPAKQPKLTGFGNDNVKAEDDAPSQVAPLVIKQEDGENPIRVFVQE